MEFARRENPAALLLSSAVLAVVFLAIAYFKDEDDTRGFIVSVAVALLVAAALFLRLWRRLETRPAYWSLIVGAVAIVSCVAFWLGLPFVFGVAAVGLGLRDAAGETRSKVGIGLGAVAVFLGAFACIFG
jgi:chromate transport protein ChrA